MGFIAGPLNIHKDHAFYTMLEYPLIDLCAPKKRLRFKMIADTSDMQVVDAMKTIGSYIKNASKFSKASKLAIQLIQAGSVKPGNSDYFFAILKAAMSSPTTCNDPRVRADNHALFLAAQDLSECFTQKQRKHLSVWTIRAVMANDLFTDDSFVVMERDVSGVSNENNPNGISGKCNSVSDDTSHVPPELSSGETIDAGTACPEDKDKTPQIARSRVTVGVAPSFRSAERAEKHREGLDEYRQVLRQHNLMLPLPPPRTRISDQNSAPITCFPPTVQQITELQDDS